MTDLFMDRSGAGARPRIGSEKGRPTGMDAAITVRIDVVIPIVFPDYRIRADLGEIKPRTVKTPVGDVRTPRIDLDLGKVPYLGHAGVLFYHGDSGLTKYFEYGRYDAAARGLVRRLPVPDVSLDTDGRTTKVSLTTVMRSISTKSGQSGRLAAAYIEVHGKFEVMHDFAKDEMSKAATKKRVTPTSANCAGPSPVIE